jgi:hypothetical protein
MISRVVPGYVVDSRTTSWPSRRFWLMVRAVASMNERSGRLSSWRGVGTQMMIASASLSRLKSPVASKLREIFLSSSF